MSDIIINSSNITDKLFQIAKEKRILISATVEITLDCNFKCGHCFIPKFEKKYISLESYMSFIDQFKAMGGLFLCLTGGEPLLHPDFSEIYIYAYQAGLSISVYTNASLINKDFIALFKRYPPRFIDISIYGASSKTYFRMTHNERHYQRVYNNIEDLLKNEIKVRLKTFICTENQEDFERIKDYAIKKNVDFRFDFKVLEKRNLSNENKKYALPPLECIDLELRDDALRQDLWRSLIKQPRKRYTNEKLFECGAGRYSCFLSCDNLLRMCAYAIFSEVNLSSTTLKDAWKSYEQYIVLTPPSESKCLACRGANLCDCCPISAYIETGDINRLGYESMMCCALAEEKYRRISTSL